jgi:hypothetical protein
LSAAGATNYDQKIYHKIEHSKIAKYKAYHKKYERY